MKSADEIDVLSLGEEAMLEALEKEAEEGFAKEDTNASLIFSHRESPDVPGRVWRRFAKNARDAGYAVQEGIDTLILRRQ